MTSPPPTPPRILALAAGRVLRLVWVNEAGGRTYAVEDGAERAFVKWAPAGSGLDLTAEAERLVWAARRWPVPRVLASGADEAGSWMVTAGLCGENAIAERWLRAPARAVRAIGAALRSLHDTLSVEGCPFSWSTPRRLAEIEARAAAGRLDPARWLREHRHLDADDLLERLREPPPIDRLVVCHGDACAPNTLLDSGGSFRGHVDLGALGVADRWADLAPATWSVRHNYGPEWVGELLAAYGVAADPERTAYYLLLWSLGP